MHHISGFPSPWWRWPVMSMDLCIWIPNTEQGFQQSAPPQTSMGMEIWSILTIGGPTGSSPYSIPILKCTSWPFGTHYLHPCFMLSLLGCSYCWPTLDQWVFTGQHASRSPHPCHRAHQQIASLTSLLSFWTIINSSPSEKQAGRAGSHHANLVKFGNYLVDYVCHYWIIPAMSWWGTSGMSL